MTKNWQFPQPIPPDALQTTITAQTTTGRRLIAENLARKGITERDAAAAFLDPDHYTPAPPGELADLDKAAERLQQAIEDGERVLVWGDFDVDGQTTTSLLVAALRDLDADVTYYIPDRITEGHGLHLPTLREKLNGVDLLLTCDTGIAAHDAVHLATQRGVTTIITDHHTLAETLPDAHAVINPMRFTDTAHPLREMPGVGVAYQLVRALYGDRPTDHLLDLVALGIVADVMVQVRDTRYWLQRGLDVLRRTQRPGLVELMDRAGILQESVNEGDIGFGIAPRLNALGRLSNANPAVELLTSSDRARVNALVNQLEGLNEERKGYGKQIYEGAQAQIASDDSLLTYAALVLHGEDWHPGVVGIVASRLSDDYNRPVVLLCGDPKNGTLRGSARSVAGCDIVAAIRSQAALLSGYGGHTMAAGLSLPPDNLLAFQRGLSENVRQQVPQAEDVPVLPIDATLNLSDLTPQLADDIAQLAPFGNGNPPLVLMTENVEISSRRQLGQGGDHLKLTVEAEDGTKRPVFYWRGGRDDNIPQGKIDIAYTLRTSIYKGQRELMIEYIDAQPAKNAPVVIEPPKPQIEVNDHRTHPDKLALLDNLLAQYPQAIVWREGSRQSNGDKLWYLSQAKGRHQLDKADTLIVWSVPPGIDEWRHGLDIVQPRRIILIGAPPEKRVTPEQLSTYAEKMCNYAIENPDEHINLTRFASGMMQREMTARLYLRELAHRGIITYGEKRDGSLDIRRGAGAAPVGWTEEARAYRQRQLRETKHYREYWLKRATDDLV